MPRLGAKARTRRRKAKRVGIMAPDSVSCRNASPKSRTGAPSNPVKILEQFCQMVGWTLSYKKWNAEQDHFAEIEIIGGFETKSFPKFLASAENKVAARRASASKALKFMLRTTMGTRLLREKKNGKIRLIESEPQQMENSQDEMPRRMPHAKKEDATHSQRMAEFEQRRDESVQRRGEFVQLQMVVADQPKVEETQVQQTMNIKQETMAIKPKVEETQVQQMMNIKQETMAIQPKVEHTQVEQTTNIKQ